MKYKLQCPQVRFHWNTATFFHLYIVYGYLGTTVVELRGWDKNHMACKARGAIYEPAL